jgi:DNA-binding transcriptional MerR regulator
MTIGEAARRLGVSNWQLREVYRKGLVPEPRRLGPFRAITPSDLPVLDAAIQKRGWRRKVVAGA